jgi:hypothetical protein
VIQPELIGILSILLFPIWFDLLLGLEKVRDGFVTVLLRWFLWIFTIICLIIGLFQIKLSQISDIFMITVLLFLAVEVLARITIKHVFELDLVKDKWPYLHRVRQAVINASLYGYYSLPIEPHPFLQFTHNRGKCCKGGDYFLGFKDIKLSDISKPFDVVRVACIGGSTTESGWPEIMEDFLNKTSPSVKFQVFNFGIGWWSSIHSTINYILNAIDFNPDYAIIHDNCNDHNYRGYPGLRGDGAHAYQAINIPPQEDIFLTRLSVLYRLTAISIIFISKRFSKIFEPKYGMEQIALKPGKRFIYDPKELYIFERNIETIYAVSDHNKIKLCLMTMPFSKKLKYSEEHDKVYRPHISKLNDILRKKALRYNLILIDAEKVMLGEEELFWDPVHVHQKGDRIKAYLAGIEILKDLGLPAEICDEWQEIAGFVDSKFTE